MRAIRRVIAWAMYFGFLSALGMIVFGYVRHTPRCTITGPLSLEHLWPDGSRLATFRMRYPWINMGWGGGRGPLQIWDAGTGQTIWEFVDDVDLRPWEISPDGRWIAVFDKDGVLRIIDWQVGEERRCIEPPASRYGQFSAKGRWLYAVPWADETVIRDMSTCQVQLQMPETAIGFSPDERWVFARKEREGEDGTPVSVWDVAAARKVATIPRDAIRHFIGGDRIDVSPDGKAIGICVPAEPVADDGLVRHRAFEIWSLPECTKRFRYELPVIGVQELLFAPDGRTVAGWLSYDNQSSKLTVFDVADGRRLWQAPVLQACRAELSQFSPDGSLFLLHQGKDSEHSLHVYDTASGQELWQQLSTGWGTFAGISVILNRAADDLPLQILDARTGKPKWTETTRPGDINMLPRLTPDARHFVIRGVQSRGRHAYFWEKWLDNRWPGLLGEGLPAALVVESATGRELFRMYGGTADDLKQILLSDDGSTLATVGRVDRMTRTDTLRVWDVHPRRAGAWALGTVAGLAILLFAVARSLRGWRNRTKTAAAKS